MTIILEKVRDEEHAQAGARGGGAASEEASPPPHAKKAKTEKQQPRTAKPAPPPAPAPPKLGASARGVTLKALLKQCGIAVSPSVYKTAAGDEAAFCAALEGLLAQEGLTCRASAAEADAVRKRRELAKDLEGIDTKNILATAGRPRRAAAAAATEQARAYAAQEADDSDESSSGGGGDDSDASGGEGAAPQPAAKPAPAARAPSASPAGGSPDAPPRRKRVLRIDEWEDDDA